MFDLELLAELLAQAKGFVAGLFEAFEGFVGFDDFGHFGFDGRKIFLGERAGQHHVVIKAAADGGAECQLDAVEQTHDGAGHDVGAGVAHDAQGGGIFAGENFQCNFAIGRQWGIEADGFAIDDRGDGGFGQAGADVGGDIFGANLLGKGFDRSVRQFDLEHGQGDGFGVRFRN